MGAYCALKTAGINGEMHYVQKGQPVSAVLADIIIVGVNQTETYWMNLQIFWSHEIFNVQAVLQL